MDLAIGTTVQAPFSEVVAATRAALGAHGFGVITEIDLQSTFAEKIGEQTDGYVILGACQPRTAFEATRAEPEIGLLLPCNVAVYETADGVRVAAVNPSALFTLVGRDDIEELAEQVRAALAAAIEEVAVMETGAPAS